MTVVSFWRRSRPRPTEPPGPAGPVGPTEAVVLSGGGSLGAAQVGALRALFEAGIRPDLLVGCSVGAMNAAFLAVDPSAERVELLEQVWRGLRRGDLFPDGRSTVAGRLLRRRDHLYSPTAVRALVDRWVPLADLSLTPVPCHVVTTDLLAGRPAWWTSGNPADVLSASVCLPAVFPPVRLGGSLHVDGGVTCPVPVQRALDCGAARVWVLDVASDFHGWPGERMSALDVLLESFAVSRSHLARHLPVPAGGQRLVALARLGVGRQDLRDFSRTEELIRVGYRAGQAMVSDELAELATGAAAEIVS